MKLSCQRLQLLSGIQTVQSVVATRSSLPVLGNILLETEKDGLRLTASDLEMGIRCDVSAEVMEPGGVALPAKRLGDIVRELPEDIVKITVRKDEATAIKCRKAAFKIAGLARDEFPRLPTLEEDAGFEIEQGKLKELIHRTVFAISRDETRYVLNGLYLLVEKGTLTVVATDGRRLAKITKELKGVGKMQREVILPGKAVTELGRILGGGEEPVRVMMGQNEVAFNLGRVLLISRVVEGKFPKYDQVIPKKSGRKVSADREELLGAMKRVALLTSERSNSVKLDVSPKGLVLSASTPEVGEATEEIDAGYEGEPVSVAFNPSYLLDFLRSEQAGEVVLEITDAMSPGVMKSVGDDSYLYVVMPIKL